MSYIGPMTENLLNTCIKELKKKTNRDKISKHIIDPIFKEITHKFYGYYLIMVFIQLIIICLLIFIAINIKK